MTNVTTKIDKNILTLTIDLSQDHGPSKSGKTIVIATTSGNVKLDHPTGAVIGLNVYKPKQ